MIIKVSYLSARASSVLSMRDEYATSSGVLPRNDGRDRRMLLFSNKKAR